MTDLITLSPFISVSLFEEYQSFRSDRIFLGNSVSWGRRYRILKMVRMEHIKMSNMVHCF